MYILVTTNCKTCQHIKVVYAFLFLWFSVYSSLYPVDTYMLGNLRCVLNFNELTLCTREFFYLDSMLPKPRILHWLFTHAFFFLHVHTFCLLSGPAGCVCVSVTVRSNWSVRCKNEYRWYRYHYFHSYFISFLPHYLIYLIASLYKH